MGQWRARGRNPLLAQGRRTAWTREARRRGIDPGAPRRRAFGAGNVRRSLLQPAEQALRPLQVGYVGFGGWLRDELGRQRQGVPEYAVSPSLCSIRGGRRR